MAKPKKTVGIIGGMGPAATVDFMARILSATPVAKDQDHLRTIVDNDPTIPSRQAAMSGEGKDPGPHIASIARQLEAQGADFLVMPCNLAHAWQSDIEAAVSIPFLSIVDVAVQSTLDRSGDDSAVGLLTTPGCFAAGLYQQALLDVGRPVITQTPDELAETMRLVAEIKAGMPSTDVEAGLRELADRLLSRGAKILIAACTEFPLVLDESMFDVAFVSTTDVLARRTVAIALGNESFPPKSRN